MEGPQRLTTLNVSQGRFLVCDGLLVFEGYPVERGRSPIGTGYPVEVDFSW